MIRDYILFDGFTIIILLNIIIVTIAKALNNSKFKQFIFIYLNNSFLKFNTNSNSFLSSFNSLLNINYLISLSVYISIIISYSSYGINNNFEIVKRISPKKGRILFFNGNILHASQGPRKSLNRCILNINLEVESELKNGS